MRLLINAVLVLSNAIALTSITSSIGYKTDDWEWWAWVVGGNIYMPIYVKLIKFLDQTNVN